MNNVQTEPSSFRDRIATVDDKGRRQWVYAQKPKGKMHNRRALLGSAYLALLLILPFIKVDGHPLFLFNVPERRFILFGQIFWPQDFFIFAVGMLLFIVFVALFTTVFGRVFCGWICPQTIFMEMVFRKVEYLIEGDAAKQKMLAQSEWNTNKILKRSAKWVSFWIISFIIANIFLVYIIGADELKSIISSPVSMHAGGFAAILIFTSVFFFIYLWFREQVCIAICPYGRLQGVLLDKRSVIVAYDYIRGEPRGKIRKKEERTSGDCIDCHQCVKVCPTGIDIRNGTQMECINCTACIDACNHMMAATGLPQNLIRYSSEESIKTGQQQRLSGRMLAYTIMMCLLLAAEGILLATRSDVSVNILRTSGQLFQTLPDGRLSNLYNYKLLNKTYADKIITMKPENFSGSIEIVGNEKLTIPKSGYATGSLFICRPQTAVTLRKTDLIVGIYEGSKKIQSVNVTFLGPFKAD